jgi:hypothetical protein
LRNPLLGSGVRYRANGRSFWQGALRSAHQLKARMYSGRTPSRGNYAFLCTHFCRGRPSEEARYQQNLGRFSQPRVTYPTSVAARPAPQQKIPVPQRST